MKLYEHDSASWDCVNPGRSPCLIAHDLAIKSTRYTMRLKETIDRRAAKIPLSGKFGFWSKYEEEYNLRLRGKKDENKAQIVASSLFKSCSEGMGETIINNQPFLLWLFQRNFINRSDVSKRFLDIVTSKIKSLNGNDTKTVLEMTNHLCSWNVVFSHQARSIAESHGVFRFAIEENAIDKVDKSINEDTDIDYPLPS
ncbi:hypothetical protein PENTCL1PPCAC_12958, partial [Pristionchus entomophagus]